MKGKKKGGLATRLARMSDEERTKYLQRKADVEEEARRRKEQLLSNFMKNKLKKEDGFSRLNIAKINQYWHQIMRADKCEYMRKDVEHLKKWINKTIAIKNNTIKKLIDELDWQEDLYGKNFQAHSKHIDNILAFHYKNLDEIANQYKNDQKLLLYVGSTEKHEIEEQNQTEVEHLKTIIYGQEDTFKHEETEIREFYLKRMDEALSDYKMEVRQMQKERDKIVCALWKQLSNIVITYIQQTELKRLHLMELQKLDSAASLTITQHDQEISKQEQELKKLQHEYNKLYASQEERIQQLQDEIESTTKSFFRMRKTLMHDLNQDEKQLAHLTAASNKAITFIESKCVKGHHLLHLARTCEKLESDRERMRNWDTDFESDVKSKKKPSEKQLITLPSLTKIRPKTSVPKPPFIKHTRQLRSEEVFQPHIETTETFAIKTRLVRNVPIKEDSITIEKKVLSRKLTKSDITSQSKSSSLSTSSNNISKAGWSHLSKLEGLWLTYNKVELDCIGMRKEKKIILQENEKLKEAIRNVLEASALGQSTLNVKHGSGSSSKRRFAFSAPISSSTVY
ncbi:hypothetical protein RN001_013201 [Aquatica leii]|uniref:Dynein regulatory complex subunit 2 n=1 Tax=Aquatica leii TaxID=1421715 RepID=A0AAN7S6W4_9COLE|nr:hypothetical protein RN001_013201 [Aquatica leii]